MSRWLESLNPEQQEAVTHVEGPLLILAGAGSGKTTVLVNRAGYLIEQGYFRADQMLILTFTNKAARELVSRVSRHLGARAKGLQAMTFHSFGLKFLRRYHQQIGYPKKFAVIDQSDAFGILRSLAESFEHYAKASFDMERVYASINYKRCHGRWPEGLDEAYADFAEWVLPKYLARLRHLAVVDFEDLILRPREILEQNQEIRSQFMKELPLVMVDEFQDTNDIQMMLLRAMVPSEKPNLTVVGDDDQAIYGFRGSRVEHILSFPGEFQPCRVIRLERNYRCKKEILDLANAVIRDNEKRHKKVLIPTRQYQNTGQTKPELFLLSDPDQEVDFLIQEIKNLQAQGVSLAEVAVLYRAHSQADALEAALVRQRIPYTISGGISFFDRKEVRDALAYIRLMVDGYHEYSFRRVAMTPPRGIGEKTWDLLVSASENEGIELYQAFKQWSRLGVSPNVGKAIDDFLGWYEWLPYQVQKWDEWWAEADSIDWVRVFFDYFQKIGLVPYLLKESVTSQRESTEVKKDSESDEGKAGVLQESPVEDRRHIPLRLLFSSLQQALEKGKSQGQSWSEAISEFLDHLQLRDILSLREDPDHPAVKLMTLHAAKGLEFDHVFLIGVEEDILPHKILATDIEEERRLLYVGITRARKGLVLTACRTRRKREKDIPVQLSRFIQNKTEVLDFHPEGVRPLQADDVKKALSDLFATLEQKSKNLQPR
jgi:DNA helicase-2/ATP-dependent DNA helicase PcrA